MRGPWLAGAALALAALAGVASGAQAPAQTERVPAPRRPVAEPEAAQDRPPTPARAPAAAPTPATPAPAPGVAVEGSDTARVAVPPELAEELDGWANAGYRVRRSGETEVTVEVRLEPLRSEAPFPAAAGSGSPAPAGGEGAPRAPAEPDPGLAAVAAEITREAETRYQAVSAVLAWTVKHVEDTADAAGAARRAVALLAEVGIEARVVEGLVAAGPGGAGPRGRHAWIEVVYPDRGGVFSDPLRTHHYVPATYLPLPASETADEGEPARPLPGAAEPAPLQAPEPPVATLVERTDRRLTVDVYPPGSPGITARKNRDRQEAGALRVVVAGEPRGSAVLAGQGGRRARELVRGEGVFVGLPAGSYTLEVFLEGRPPTRREVVLAPRERSVVYLPDSRSAASLAVSRPGDPVRKERP